MNARGATWLLLLCAGCAAPPHTSASASATRCDVASAPSYQTEVAPVLESRCFRCHAGDGPAAEEHDFSNSVVRRAQARRIADAVEVGAMPPRSAGRLAPAEIATLSCWARAGAPDG